jgi:predicted nucleic acid-binding protein
MYLVDTSVWIDFFKGRDEPAVLRLSALLEADTEIGLTSVIYQEVLQGARDETWFRRLQDYLSTQTLYQPLDPLESYEGAARIYFACRRKGITVRSTIDCLIARIALEHDLVLLHNDRDYEAIARVMPQFKIASS